MSSSNHIITAAIVFLLSACAGKDSYDWGWVDSLGKDYPVEFETFNSKWALALTNEIDPDVYAFDGSGSLISSYTGQPDTDVALRVADYLDSEILPLFPKEIITRCMPSQIYVADSVYVVFYDEAYDAVFNENTRRWKQLHTNQDRRRLLYGDVGANHLTLAARCMDDPSMQAELKFNWTSLIIERMLANTRVWPVLDEFVKYSEAKFSEVNILFTYKYYQDSLSDGDYYFRCLCSDLEGDWCYWYYCGSVRGSRCFYTGRCTFTSEYMTATGGGPDPDLIQCWYRLTYRQDFADLLAFLLLTTPEEREAFIAPKDKWERIWREESHVIDREVFDRKLAMVKDYVEEHFDWKID